MWLIQYLTKELQSVYTIPPYEKIIQVGAALTDKRVSENVLVDCEGIIYPIEISSIVN